MKKEDFLEGKEEGKDYEKVTNIYDRYGEEYEIFRADEVVYIFKASTGELDRRIKND